MLWITYAWADNAEGDFDFLVNQIREAGIDARYDKVQLVPGRRLWEQIADRITSDDLDGWAILLTKHSVESQACREELAYALDRALRAKGGIFPLLGLMHGIALEDVPPPLRVRLLVSLRDPRWREQVLAGLRNRPALEAPTGTSVYRWEIIPNFRGEGTVAFWVRPRLSDLPYFRFIYPVGAKLLDWGPGAPQKEGFTGMMTMSMTGGKATITVPATGKVQTEWLGAATATIGTGAYIVFGNPAPGFVGFAIAGEPFGPPIDEGAEIIKPGGQ